MLVGSTPMREGYCMQPLNKIINLIEEVNCLWLKKNFEFERNDQVALKGEEQSDLFSLGTHQI